MADNRNRPRAVLSSLWTNHAQVLTELRKLEHGLTVLTTGPAPDAGGPFVTIAPYVQRAAQTLASVPVATRDRLHASYRQAMLDQGIEAPFFEHQLASTIPWGQASDALRLQAALDLLLADYDIALVALSEDVTLFGKTIALWARQRAIPSVHILHAIPLLSPYTVHGELSADSLAVYGKRSFDAYIDAGFAPERLHIVGNPSWDIHAKLRGDRPRLKAEVQAKYGLNVATKTIMFATTWAANLSAMCDQEIHIKSLLAVLKAYRTLIDRGVAAELVIKDRPANAQSGASLVEKAIVMLGMEDYRIVYAYEDGVALCAAADVVVAVDSNMLVEAMHLGVPAVNLLDDMGVLMGTSFEAETGILEAEAEQLPAALEVVLTSAETAQQMAERHLNRVSHYNIGAEDGGSTRRVAELLKQQMKPVSRPPEGYVWERFLNVEAAPVVASYHGAGRDSLVAMIQGAPRRALDVGCATGANGALIKRRFPQCQVWGVETNRAAADHARKRLDRVLVGRLDEFDLEKEGLPKGELDAVLFADVLEHMYDPWRALVEVRKYLSDDGDVIVSIPNVRNLAVLDGLLGRGAWRYEPEGILDITHIRFFTKAEFVTAAHETGYRVDAVDRTIDGRLRGIFESVTSFPAELSGDNYTLRNLSRDEFTDLCTVQFYFRLKKMKQAPQS